MAKKRDESATRERKRVRKTRIMLSFSTHDYEMLLQDAEEAQLPIATFARIVVLRRQRQVAPTSKTASASR